MSTPDDRRSPLEELLGEIPREEPSPGFAGDLRAKFVAGFPDVAAEGDRTDARGPARSRSLLRSRWLWTGLAAAALAGVLLVRGGADAGPWLPAPGSDVPTAFVADLNAGRAVTADERCDLCLTDGLDVRLLAGTRVTADHGSSPDWLDLAVDAGEILIKTRADYRGPGLRVATPHGRVVVTGTVLSVKVEPHLICVCVLEGDVQVEQEGRAPVAVGAENRHFAFAEGSAPWQVHGPGLSEPIDREGGSNLMSPEAEERHVAPLRAFAAE